MKRGEFLSMLLASPLAALAGKKKEPVPDVPVSVSEGPTYTTGWMQARSTDSLPYILTYTSSNVTWYPMGHG